MIKPDKIPAPINGGIESLLKKIKLTYNPIELQFNGKVIDHNTLSSLIEGGVRINESHRRLIITLLDNEEWRLLDDIKITELNEAENYLRKFNVR